jgi:hypothetical protein
MKENTSPNQRISRIIPLQMPPSLQKEGLESSINMQVLDSITKVEDRIKNLMGSIVVSSKLTSSQK